MNCFQTVSLIWATTAELLHLLRGSMKIWCMCLILHHFVLYLQSYFECRKRDTKRKRLPRVPEDVGMGLKPYAPGPFPALF